MKTFLLPITLVFLSISSALAEDVDIAKETLRRIVNAEASLTLSVATARPDKHITEKMVEIDKIGQSLLKQEQTDDVIAVSESCLSALAVLRERRIYAYMLWAEGLLEKSTTGKYADLESLDQETLVALYCRLSEINISIIRENMLNREIMSRLAEIYDRLDRSNKRLVRVRAIQQQRDALSTVVNGSIRKALDDF